MLGVEPVELAAAVIATVEFALELGEPVQSGAETVAAAVAGVVVAAAAEHSALTVELTIEH